MALRLSLDRYLKKYGLTTYRLAKEVESEVARSSVYDLARGDEVRRVDLKTLSAVLEGLTTLTGQQVTPNDLIQVVDPE